MPHTNQYIAVPRRSVDAEMINTKSQYRDHLVVQLTTYQQEGWGRFLFWIKLPRRERSCLGRAAFSSHSCCHPLSPNVTPCCDPGMTLLTPICDPKSEGAESRTLFTLFLQPGSLYYSDSFNIGFSEYLNQNYTIFGVPNVPHFQMRQHLLAPTPVSEWVSE